jgi:hypothetical protein
MFKRMSAMMMAALVIGAVALSTGLVSAPCAMAATATEVVSADKAIPAATNTATTVTLSKTYTAKPLTLAIYNATPTNGVARLSTVRTLGDGTVYTNTFTSLTLTALGGTGQTNLSSLVTGYLFPREPLYVTFDVFTNGAFQVVGELYGIGK